MKPTYLSIWYTEVGYLVINPKESQFVPILHTQCENVVKYFVDNY